MSKLCDPEIVKEIVDLVLKAHPSEIAEYKAGKEKLIGFFVGYVMKTTRGTANPGLVNELLKERLKDE